MKHLSYTFAAILTVAFNVNAQADALLVDEVGRVGINTADPSAGLSPTDDTNLRVMGTIRGEGTFGAKLQAGNPGFWLDETGTGNKGAYFVLDGRVVQMQRRAQNFGGFEASVFRVFVNAPSQSFVLAESGNIGLGVFSPDSPIHSDTGAKLSAGGQWLNASSRSKKDGIRSLSAEQAMETLASLEPVTFKYKTDPGETNVGFIAEDVPDLVATNSRDTLAAMDIVAVLTRAVQEQQKIIETKQSTIEVLNARVSEQNDRLQRLESAVQLLAAAADASSTLK